jgi:DNA repair protein RecN (Recombination protein N)
VTRSDVRVIAGEQRVAELARMLSGRDSDTAREHAAELLASAAAEFTEAARQSGRRRARASKTPA